MDANHLADHYLIDTANLRRHTVVEDEGGMMLEPDQHTQIPYDEPTPMTVFFASAQDMESVDVYIFDFPPILDVPVTTAQEEGE